MFKINAQSFPEDDFDIYYLREFLELSHARQLQEAVWLFVGGRARDAGMQIQCTGTVFRHF